MDVAMKVESEEYFCNEWNYRTRKFLPWCQKNNSTTDGLIRCKTQTYGWSSEKGKAVQQHCHLAAIYPTVFSRTEFVLKKMLKQRTTFLGALSFHKLDALLNSFIVYLSPKGRSNLKKNRSHTGVT
jgi:hypothetical protein